MTPNDPQKHHRRSIRLKGYDYTQPGAYFVTMVAWRRLCLFGEIVGEKMRLSPMGEVVQNTWQRLPVFFPVRLDGFIVMPNHFHAVLWLEEDRMGEATAIAMLSGNRNDLADASPQPPKGTQPGSLGAIIQNFKSTSTRIFNRINGSPGAPLWQRNYYERIIRDEGELGRILDYIQTNLLRWDTDQLRLSHRTGFRRRC